MKNIFWPYLFYNLIKNPPTNNRHSPSHIIKNGFSLFEPTIEFELIYNIINDMSTVLKMVQLDIINHDTLSNIFGNSLVLIDGS